MAAELALSPDRRAQWDANMVMVRHLVRSCSSGAEAQQFYRELVEQCRFLQRHHESLQGAKLLPIEAKRV